MLVINFVVGDGLLCFSCFHRRRCRHRISPNRTAPQPIDMAASRVQCKMSASDFYPLSSRYLASPHHRWYTYSSPTEKNSKQSLGASVTEHKRGAPPICCGPIRCSIKSARKKRNVCSAPLKPSNMPLLQLTRQQKPTMSAQLLAGESSPEVMNFKEHWDALFPSIEIDKKRPPRSSGKLLNLHHRLV